MNLEGSITYVNEPTNYKVNWTIKNWKLVSHRIGSVILSEYNDELQLCFRMTFLGNGKILIYYKSKHLRPAPSNWNEETMFLNNLKSDVECTHAVKIQSNGWNRFLTCTLIKRKVNLSPDLNFAFIFTTNNPHNVRISGYDIVLKTADNVSLVAKKSILSHWSAVFRKCFEYDRLQSKECDSLEVPFKSEQLTEVLSYMYTGELKDIQDPVKLLAVANYYNLEHLKEQCVDILVENLCMENVKEFMKLAELYKIESLHMGILKFISANGPEIIKTVDFALIYNLCLSFAVQ